MQTYEFNGQQSMSEAQIKTIKEAREWAFSYLKASNINDPIKELDFILSHVMQMDRSYLLAHLDKNLSPETLVCYQRLIKERAQGIAFAHLTHGREFMGLNFSINRDVFIPRPETELLVEEGLHWLKSNRDKLEKPVKIADLCTGSGAVGLSLAYYGIKEVTQEVFVTLTDISEPALQQAQENAIRLELARYCQIGLSDLFQNLDWFHTDQKFHLITVNPPYVKPEEYGQLSKEVQNEPAEALLAFPDGLSFYRRIAREFKYYMERNGLLIMEVGDGQARRVSNIFSMRGYVTKISRDLGGKERAVLVFEDFSGKMN